MNKDHNFRFWHESFEKSFYLYGLYQSRNKIREVNKVIIVEGEFDALSFHSFGFTITVACSGSSFSLYQIALLSRYCTDFYLLFDGDEAGRKAIKRTMNIYNEYNLGTFGLNFIPVYLPKDTDPDEFLFQEGKQGVKNLLKTSKEECNFYNKG
jgi:DNA primase